MVISSSLSRHKLSLAIISYFRIVDLLIKNTNVDFFIICVVIVESLFWFRFVNGWSSWSRGKWIIIDL